MKLVYPNRTGVGRIRDISPSLSKLIQELLHEKTINQASYDALPISDQRVIHDIIESTRLQYTFTNPLEDPRERLQSEFEKLKGEFMLGNDNPSLIKELKSLSIDLYSQKLISEKDFRDILITLL